MVHREARDPKPEAEGIQSYNYTSDKLIAEEYFRVNCVLKTMIPKKFLEQWSSRVKDSRKFLVLEASETRRF